MELIPFAAEAAQGGVQDVRGAHTDLRYAATRRHRVYEPAVIPGPLQCVVYVVAIQGFWDGHLRPDHDERERLASVAEALEGQRRRAGLVLATRLDVVIEEAALWSAIGGPAVLAAQLDYLLELIDDLPSLSVAVIPSGAPRAVPPVSGFWIFDSSLVATETSGASLSDDDPARVAAHEKLFAELHGLAVTDASARLLIDRVRQLIAFR